MERLIYSSSIPSRIRQGSTALPPLSRIGLTRRVACGVAPVNWTRGSEPCRFKFKPVSCSIGEPYFVFPETSNGGPEKDKSLPVGGSIPKLPFLKSVAGKLSQQQKKINAGAAILLSAIFLIASPAFATLPTAANATTAPASLLLRSELLTSAWTGFFAGCLHTLSGPDHLAALAPLSIGRTKMESAAVGALWGCGHDAGQVLFGLLFLLLKDRLHIEVIRTWGTRIVGLTLLVIGAMGIREAYEVPEPCVVLENGECDVSGFDEPVSGKKKKIGFATFATGIVHGLQPDALMMILPALALPSRVAGAAFLVMFLVGTVVAMGSYTVFIGSCSQALKDRIPRITEKLTWASSLVAIGLGVAIIVSQYFGLSLY